MRKKPFIFIFSLIVIVFACTAYAVYFLKPVLEEKLLNAVEQALGKEIEVVDIDVNLAKGIVSLRGLKAEDLKLLKYPNTAAADEIILDIDWLATLLQKGLNFQEVHLKNLVFNLENRKRPAQSSVTSRSAPPAESGEASPKSKGLLSSVHIDKLSIENSNFVFEDYYAASSPAVIEISGLNGSIEDLSISLHEGKGLKGTVHLKGALNSEYEGLFELDGPFAINESGTDFDFTLDIDSANLTGFSPYYSDTSFTILKQAKVDIDSKAGCQQNRLNASQKVRIYDIELYDIKPGGKDRLFGLPAKTVIDFFEDVKGEVKFSFDLVGMLDDLKIDPGPIMQQVLSNALRDKIFAELQELPREVIKMSEKALDEHLGIGEDLKAFDGDKAKKAVRSLKKEIGKIFGAQ